MITNNQPKKEKLIEGNYTEHQKDGSDNELDAYALLSIGGSYQVGEHFTFKAGVTNLTDKLLDSTDQDYEDTEIGRSFYAKLDF